MPRFGDRWVVDRTLFEYVNGGSCACCGFNHLLPNRTANMIHAMSDLETDAANAEVNALATSPWPPDMKDQVWGDRLKLRHLMKKEMSQYKQFWNLNGPAIQLWAQEQPPLVLKKIFQMPRAEITEKIKQDYGIHSAFAVVLCTVVEQVANYPLTQLPTDARSEAEKEFEEALVFDRRGGFTLVVEDKKTKTLREDTLQIWFERMKSLGGPKLLERAPPKKKKNYDSSDEEEEEGDADDGLKVQENDNDDANEGTSDGPSFRSDRRIIRLLIARYWADQMMKKFLETQFCGVVAIGEGGSAPPPPPIIMKKK